LLLWIVRLSIQKKAVVRTVHNQRPHDAITGKWDRFLFDHLSCLSQHEIWLQDPALIDRSPKQPFTIVPHGLYTPWVNEVTMNAKAGLGDVSEVTDDRLSLLVFGILKSYKNIHEPVKAVRDSRASSILLRIIGSAPDHEYLSHLRSIADNDPRIVITPGRVNDEALIEHILSSDIVVVPYPNMFNSGVVLLALSLNRPVAVQRNKITESLQQEFGPEWVFMYDDLFDSEALHFLQGAVHTLGAGSINHGTNRSWEGIGRSHVEIYKSVTNNDKKALI